ncbi:hypothetical protein GGS23DRAFT_171693 [Durotheca rogersii]|uniref:uncharacterized protein n=1 Tax=Durotheca rogersii TaxID=419775 RepID=UPI00222037AC|nr:uncharacterized protein GGS23DRAFT_171693 [Durotheca rogersii]KAI5867337.1 hypothetical protein GGS23DRAFT_171693 [Durotheca rogersii]
MQAAGELVSLPPSLSPSLPLSLSPSLPLSLSPSLPLSLSPSLPLSLSPSLPLSLSPSLPLSLSPSLPLSLSPSLPLSLSPSLPLSLSPSLPPSIGCLSLRLDPTCLRPGLVSWSRLRCFGSALISTEPRPRPLRLSILDRDHIVFSYSLRCYSSRATLLLLHVKSTGRSPATRCYDRAHSSLPPSPGTRLSLSHHLHFLRFFSNPLPGCLGTEAILLGLHSTFWEPAIKCPSPSPAFCPPGNLPLHTSGIRPQALRQFHAHTAPILSCLLPCRLYSTASAKVRYPHIGLLLWRLFIC